MKKQKSAVQKTVKIKLKLPQWSKYLVVMSQKPELYRKQGPGQPPLAEHEWRLRHERLWFK